MCTLNFLIILFYSVTASQSAFFSSDLQPGAEVKTGMLFSCPTRLHCLKGGASWRWWCSNGLLARNSKPGELLESVPGVETSTDYSKVHFCAQYKTE